MGRGFLEALEDKELHGEVYKSIGITSLHYSHELSSEVYIMITGNDEIVPLDETIGKMTKVKVNGGTTGWMLTKFISGYSPSNKQVSQGKKIDIKNQCLEFGFTEGTESFADCQLQLTILEKQSNNSNQTTNNNSQNDYMKQQNEFLQKQLEIQQHQQVLKNKRKSDDAYDILMDTIQCLGNSILCSTAYDKGCYYDLKGKGYTDQLAYKKCKFN